MGEEGAHIYVISITCQAYTFSDFLVTSKWYTFPLEIFFSIFQIRKLRRNHTQSHIFKEIKNELCCQGHHLSRITQFLSMIRLKWVLYDHKGKSIHNLPTGSSRSQYKLPNKLFSFIFLQLQRDWDWLVTISDKTFYLLKIFHFMTLTKNSKILSSLLDFNFLSLEAPHFSSL